MNIESQIIEYVEKCLEQGYTIAQIRHALINYGHKENFIDEIIYREKDIDSIDKKELNNIENNLNKLDENKKKVLIEKEINKIEKKDIKEYAKLKESVIKFLLPISLLFFLMIVFLLSIFTSSAFTRIIIALLPVPVTIIALYFFMNILKFDYYLFIIGPIITLIFYVILSNSGSEILLNMELVKINILNLVLVIGYSIAFFMLKDHRAKALL